jgi:hypothetical protein
MAYDPLFLETPIGPELRAELGIPAGAVVRLVHFPLACQVGQLSQSSHSTGYKTGSRFI